MSKKHFIALADSLKAERHHWELHYGPAAFEALLAFTIRYCASQSPRFNAHRFQGYVMGQCGPNGGSK